jgi:uncharacterized small protein (DUF1192 family)
MMDDEDLPCRRSDELAALTRQNLDPLSQDELADRIAVLEAEIARTRAQIAAARAQRSAAEALFKRG